MPIQVYQFTRFIRQSSIVVYLIIGTVFIVSFGSCRKESFNTGSDVKLRFSVDTLRFDTVFTTLGSATRSFKVFNDYNSAVRIQYVKLENSTNGKFRINVDGNAGELFDNIEIPANDSIYIFVEVTVNPDQPLSLSPFIIEQNINFFINGNQQQVALEAWGQNANYIPNRYNQGQFALLSCNLGEITWSDPKPYVIYGVLFIDSCTLRIPHGTKVYIHGGLGRTPDLEFYNDGMLFFLDKGRLIVDGTVENPVLFTSDRLEPEFKSVPGQYAGIRFNKGSTGPHRLTHAIIRNSLFGIYADSSSNVNLNSVTIANTTSSGLIGIRANITAVNCLFYDNYGAGANLIFGGNYEFTYCTFSNHGLSKEALQAQNFVCRNSDCSLIELYPINLKVTNSILHNAGKDVLNLSDGSNQMAGFFNYSFDHCLLRVNDLLKKLEFSNFNNKCVNCVPLQPNSKLFLKVLEKDFSLDTMSLARDKGVHLPLIDIDIRGLFRKNPPDVGCYEFH
jgi:hypothetical protein